MDSDSFFIQRPADARLHLGRLTAGLKRLAVVGLVVAGCCGLIAILLGWQFLDLTYRPHPNDGLGILGIFGLAFLAGAATVVLVGFSALYLVLSWSLARRWKWSRYAGRVIFSLKILLSVFLGLSSPQTMIAFLVVASWDLYGLWVMLSKGTEQLFTSLETN